MKCAQCGLPLSPSRTNCPRCGASAGKASGKIRLTRDTAPPPPYAHSPAGIDTLNRTPPVWPAMTPPVTPSRETPTEQEAFPPAGGFITPAAAFFPTPPSNAAYGQNQVYMPNTPPAPGPYQTPTPALKPIYSSGNLPRPRQLRTRLGFTVAAICFTAGIIIMAFVFIMAQSLSPNNLASSTSAKSKPHAASVPTQPAVTPTPTTAQATPTLTPTITANQYINNVNLASSVDVNTGTALQTATEFHANQSIYVTMTIQQAAYNGAVCLDWSVNNQAYPYVNSATPSGATYLTQTNAYFYYKPGIIGNGIVKVSWASSTACTDKVLIQTLNFIVIA
jgi:hypothetical protein